MTVERITNFAAAAHLVRHDHRRKVVILPHEVRRRKRVPVRFLDWFWTWPWEPWLWLRAPRSRMPFWRAEHIVVQHIYPADGLIRSVDDCVIDGGTIYIGPRLQRRAMEPLLDKALNYTGRTFTPQDRLTDYRR